MVASPWVGTKLDEEQVIGIVKKWGHARVIESRRRALIGGGVAAGMACLILGAGILVWPDSKSGTAASSPSERAKTNLCLRLQQLGRFMY